MPWLPILGNRITLVQGYSCARLGNVQVLLQHALPTLGTQNPHVSALWTIFAMYKMRTKLGKIPD